MASRVETIPEDFLNHLAETIPGFSKENKKHQFELARMAWIGVSKTNQHSHFKDAMSFTYQELERWFGRANFNLVNRHLGFFNMTPGWSKEKKFTRGYFFSELLRSSIDAYLALSPWPTKTRLIKADGKARTAILHAVASKDKCGVSTNAWVNAKSLANVQVNQEALAALKSELQKACDDWRVAEETVGTTSYPELAHFERAIEMIGKVSRLAMTDGAGASRMVHSYEEAKSGRLYPVGISLASVQSVIKDAALAGCWEYDISNCHYSILDQMASKAGYECLAVAHYLKNKDAVRAEIATHAKISIDDAKTCLVALIYGARVSASPKTAIAEAIGVPAAKLLKSSPIFKGLAKDIAKAQNVILSTCAKTAKGWYLNAFGKSISHEENPDQIMSHILQGAEAKALQAAINLYPKDIVIVQHDGFASTRRLDAASISKAIHAATGLNLLLAEKQLKAGAYGYFLSRMT